MTSNIDAKERDKKYNFWARKQPALISLVIPFLLIIFFFLNNESQISDAKYITNLFLSVGSIMPALFFFYTFLIRDVSKGIIEKCIIKQIHYPTTYLLCKESTKFTEELKTEIKEKIRERFNINILNISNPSIKNSKYTKRIEEIVSRIREQTRSNHILFEFNCIYGFYRNLTAGFLVDIMVVLLVIFIPPISTYIGSFQNLLVPIACILLALSLICLWCSFINGKRYARRLYITFLDLKDEVK